MRRLSFFLFMLASVTGAGADIFVTDNSVRATYEELTLPGNESLGLLGTSYLLERKLNRRTGFYAGIGVYSAVSGQRGGFFTGGAEAGVRYRIGRVMLDGGLFLGGGGGGAAPQGGGLMLRPHLGALGDFGRLRLGLQYSKVHFPNGNIESDQVAVVAEYAFQGVFADAVPDDLSSRNIGMASITMAPTVMHYDPTRSAKLSAGVQSMGLGGIEIGRFLTDSSFFFLESAAAARGSADGYAELLGGFGYRYRLGERVALQLRVSAGAGGGGAVDTGGGAIYKATLGAEIGLSRKLAIGLDYGIVDATGGSFEAEMLRLSLRYGLRMAAVSDSPGGIDPSHATLGNWALRLSHQTYLADPTLRKGAGGGDVSLIGLKLDREVTDRLYLTGQATAAYEGSAGGFASGLLGIGYKQELAGRLGMRAELLVGPAGGGGLNTSGGGIVQPMIGLTYQLSKAVDLSLMAGKIAAFKGNLDTGVVDAGLIYRFGTLESR